MITPEFLQRRPLSYNSLKMFRRSPEHYIHYLTSPKKKTPAFIFGALLDCMLLTPDMLEKRFIKSPDITNLKKWEKDQIMEDFALKNPLKEVVSNEDWHIAERMIAKANAHAKVKSILNRITKTQTEYRWIDPETQLPCITITDAEGDNLELEIKTARSADEEQFMKDAGNYQYHFQKGMYAIGHQMNGKKNMIYKYLVFEKEEPYGLHVFSPSSDFVDYGKFIFQETIRSFKICMNEQAFDMSYDFNSITGESQLDLPKWIKSGYAFQNFLKNKDRNNNLNNTNDGNNDDDLSEFS